MAITARQGVVFASGLLFGAVATAVLVMTLRPSPQVDAKPTASLPQLQKVSVAAKARPAEPAPQAAAASSRQHADCPLQPLLISAGRQDGQLRLQDVSSKTAADMASFILAGKEAAAAGRRRDAEVAFAMSCRIADRIRGPDSIESADARYQLGRHYSNVAQAGAAAPRIERNELVRQAELLYADSLASYVARHGKEHEKSRFAAEGLAGVRQTLAAQGVKPAQPSAADRKPVQAAAAKPAPVQSAPAAVVAGAAEPLRSGAAAQPQPSRPLAKRPRQPRHEVIEDLPVREATGSASGAAMRPSFDCAKARSPSERAICADAELSGLDRNLGRLHARARNATPDAAAFRRQNDQEWRRRESTCRGDRECLRQWYAQRREQLMEEVD